MNTRISWHSLPPASTRPLALLLLTASWLAPWGAVAAAEPGRPRAHTYFVATNGNDAWSGTLATPNRAQTDGPFASLGRARDAVRELKRTAGAVLRRPVTVWVRGGTYLLSTPIVFTPADSGGDQAEVRFQAYRQEQPVLSGGQRVHDWKPETVNGKAIWVAKVPAVGWADRPFHQLWIDGQRRTPARHPKRGYLEVEGLVDAKPDSAWSEGVHRFRFKAGDLRAWTTATNAEVCVMNRWVESHLPIASVNETDRVVTSRKRSVFKLDPGDLYYVENALELLDTPGEWYLDVATARLYYLPKPGEDLNHAEVIVPALSQLVRFEGKPEAGQLIHHLVFSGLAFAHTEWYFPSGFYTGRNKPEVSPPPRAEVGGFAQAAVGVPGAVWAEGLCQSKFAGCRFVHLGNYGLTLGRGCQHNVVSACEFAELGGGGVQLGETAIRETAAEVAADNEVSDCRIHDGGLFYHSAIGVWIGQSPGNRLVHNEIHDFYYTGISIGWTWGYGKALATNNLVEYNHIHHIGIRSDGEGPILSDLGGIYTLGLHSGTVIRNNLWHDFAGFRYGGWGIYFDEGTTGILAENNLVYRSTHGGFHQHYGKENLVRNNIFAYARDHQLQRSRVEAHRSFTFEHNLLLWDQGKLFGGNLSDTNYFFRSNLYWREGSGEIRFDKWSFEDWQKRGQDAGAMIANPEFANPQQGNFTIPRSSPAHRIGFKPFDLKGVGPRAQRTRK